MGWHLRVFLSSTFILLFLLTPASVRALGGPNIVAYEGSNVSIDGTFQTSEWSDAAHVSFNWAWTNSSLANNADLWIKNNGTNLLVAVSAAGQTKLGTPTDGYQYALLLLFNDNNNGTVNNYDAEKELAYNAPPSGQGWQYLDMHFDTSQGTYVQDGNPNGTAVGTFTNYGGPGTWYWEFSIPMKSSILESFNLPVNGTIGFEIIYAEYQLLNRAYNIITGFSYWPTPYTTAQPNGTKPSANGWANIARSASRLPPPPNSPSTPWYLNTWTFIGTAAGLGTALASMLLVSRRRKHKVRPTMMPATS